jgi:tRNA (guanine-N7-)-methyltransferase
MRTESPKHLAHGKDEEWDTGHLLLDDRAGESPVDFAKIFGNSRPVEIEIGSGKGTFLLARAQARPELNFLGIEWAGAYARYCADRFRRNALENVRMLHTDATEFLQKCVPDDSVWRVHIYFPDPWPKKRHHRRRSIQKPFVEEIHRILKPGGQLIIVTDHQEYFMHIQQVLANAAGFARIAFPQMCDSEGELVGTNFEKKYIAQGRPFYNIARMKYK